MESIIRVVENIDWITIIIFSSLLFIAIAKGMFYNRFMNFIILPFNNKYIFVYNKKGRLINWFNIFFSFFQLINFSLFLFFIWSVLWGTKNEIIFKKLSYLNHSALIMLLANIVLTYVLKDSKPVIYISIFLILLINGIGWATLIKNHQKFIVNNFFYFILYLCALEIAPFVIIGSYLK